MRKGMYLPKRFEPPIATKDELDAITQAAFFLLENVGVGEVSTDLCNVYKKLGCDVDMEKKIVKIPQTVAEEGIDAIPSTIVLCGRNPKEDCLIEAGSRHLFVGGFGLFSMFAEWDPNTRRYSFRDATQDDNWKYQKIVEYFPEYDMVCPMYLPMDLASAGLPADIHETNSTLQCTTKHIWHIDALDHVDEYARLGAELLGGKEELAKRPIMTLHTDTPGLVFGKKTSDRIYGTLKSWEEGYNILSDHTDVCISGFQGPASLTGSYAVTVASSIAQAVAMGLNHPGKIPNMTYNLVMPLDPYTQVIELAPAAMRLHIAYWHKAHSRPKVTMCPYIGGMGGMVGASDTQNGQLYLWVAAYEAGTDQMGMWPILHTMAIWLEGYAIFAELKHYLKWHITDLDFSKDEFGFDLWPSKGPRGDFSDDKATLERLTTLSYAGQNVYNLTEGRPYAKWIEDKKTMDDRAYELIKKVVNEFPAPLPPKDIKERMDAIVKESDKKYKIGK